MGIDEIAFIPGLTPLSIICRHGRPGIFGLGDCKKWFQAIKHFRWGRGILQQVLHFPITRAAFPYPAAHLVIHARRIPALLSPSPSLRRRLCFKLDFVIGPTLICESRSVGTLYADNDRVFLSVFETTFRLYKLISASVMSCHYMSPTWLGLFPSAVENTTPDQFIPGTFLLITTKSFRNILHHILFL